MTEYTYPAFNPDVDNALPQPWAKRLLGQDLTAQTLTIVTFLIRLLIAGMMVEHYVLGLNGLYANIGIRFFSMTGSFMVAMIRYGEWMNYQKIDVRRSHRALRSVPISLAFSVYEGWEFFSIFM